MRVSHHRLLISDTLDSTLRRACTSPWDCIWLFGWLLCLTIFVVEIPLHSQTISEKPLLNNDGETIPVNRRAVDPLAGIAPSAVSVAAVFAAIAFASCAVSVAVPGAIAVASSSVRVFHLAVVSLPLTFLVVAWKMKRILLIRTHFSQKGCVTPAPGPCSRGLNYFILTRSQKSVIVNIIFLHATPNIMSAKCNPRPDESPCA